MMIGGYGTHKTISMFVTSVSSLKLRLKVSVKSKKLISLKFLTCSRLCFYITLIVPVDSYGHGGTVGEPIHTFARQFRPIFICKRKFCRIYFRFTTSNILIVYINRSMDEKVSNDASTVRNCLTDLADI